MRFETSDGGTMQFENMAAKVARANAVVRAGLSAVTAAAAMAVPSPVWAQQRGDYYGPHMMWDGGWYGMLFGPMMMVLFLAVIVIVVVLLVRWLGGTGHGRAVQPPSGKIPLDILKERFARGEIDKEEYEERRRTLEQ